MPDAYTYTKGSEMKTFSTRAELYDHMIAVGEVILEGDDAPKFEEHCNKRKVKDPNAQKALDKIANMR